MEFGESGDRRETERGTEWRRGGRTRPQSAGGASPPEGARGEVVPCSIAARSAAGVLNKRGIHTWEPWPRRVVQVSRRAYMETMYLGR